MPLSAEDKETTAGAGDESALREGLWIHFGTRYMLGAGTDSYVLFIRKGEKWFITVAFREFYMVRERRPPSFEHYGPVEVTVKDHVAHYRGPHGPVKESFRFDGDALLLPGIAQQDRRTWKLTVTETSHPAFPPRRTSHKTFLWRCRFDPRETAVGPAEFRDTPRVDAASPTFYIFTREKDATTGEDIEMLRFVQQYPTDRRERRIREWCRFIWDSHGRLKLDRHRPVLYQAIYRRADKWEQERFEALMAGKPLPPRAPYGNPYIDGEYAPPPGTRKPDEDKKGQEKPPEH